MAKKPKPVAWPWLRPVSSPSRIVSPTRPHPMSQDLRSAADVPLVLWGPAGARRHVGSGRHGQWHWWSGHCACGSHCRGELVPSARVRHGAPESLAALTQHLHTTAATMWSDEAFSNWTTHPDLTIQHVEDLLSGAAASSIGSMAMTALVGRLVLDPTWAPARRLALLTRLLSGNVQPRRLMSVTWLTTIAMPAMGVAHWWALRPAFSASGSDALWIEAATAQPTTWWATLGETGRREGLLDADRRVREQVLRSLASQAQVRSAPARSETTTSDVIRPTEDVVTTSQMVSRGRGGR